MREKGKVRRDVDLCLSGRREKAGEKKFTSGGELQPLAPQPGHFVGCPRPDWEKALVLFLRG